MDALSLVYPQYLLQGDCEASFRKHLDVIKKKFGEPKWIFEEESNKFVPPVMDCSLLELQQLMFKLAMFSNSMAAMKVMKPLFLVNPLIEVRRSLDANSALAKTFSEYKTYKNCDDPCVWFC